MYRFVIILLFLVAMPLVTFAQNYSITVVKTGIGSGRVYDNVPYLDCGTMCTAYYSAGTTVTLSALADENSQFYGWSGPCSGTGDCVITLTSDVTVTARFGCIDGMEQGGMSCGLNMRGIEITRCIEGDWTTFCSDPDFCMADTQECEGNVFKRCALIQPGDYYDWVVTECVDDSVCTEDSCNAAQGCVFDPAPREGELCRGAVDVCDEPEYCDGTHAACPFDLKKDPQTLCRDRNNNSVCDLPEHCDGVSDACPIDQWENAGVPCREAEGDCDKTEYCTGSSPECPNDEIEPEGVVCRPVYSDCDIEERCDGSSKSCPEDTFLPNTSVCRTPVGQCDMAEYCTGDSPDCPEDQKLTILCRGATEPCDIPEYCDGQSNDCPDDLIADTTVMCREATGSCDLPEYCDGEHISCPPDAIKTANEVCRFSIGTCDADEYCDGSSKECPPEDFTSTNGLSCVDAFDYTTNETCANGFCIGAEVIGSCSSAYEATSYPYVLETTTVGRPSHLTDYGTNCPVTNAPLGDVVVRFATEAGVTYTVSITRHGGWTGFMAIIPICSTFYTNATCLNQDATADSFTYTPLLGGTATLVIESLSNTGDFTLTIEREETPQPDNLITDDDVIEPTDEILPDETLIDDAATDDTVIDEEETDDVPSITDDGSPLVDDTVKPDDTSPTDTDTIKPDADTTKPDTVTDTDAEQPDETIDETVADAISDTLLADEDTTTVPDKEKKSKDSGCSCSVVF